MKIDVNAVEKRFGNVTALDGPSFTIPEGSTYGLLGTNGAGKTTLFEILVGHSKPDAGQITVGGVDVTNAGAELRDRVGYLPEQVGFPGLLTGREILEIHADIRGLCADRTRRLEEVLDLVGLATAADRRVEGYSNGMRRRLGLAATLLGEPGVLVLDEPTAGLDPRGVATFHEIVERIDRETGATVILSSHVLPEVEELCDAVAVLHDGHLCAAGPISELTKQTAETVTITVKPTYGKHREALYEAFEMMGSLTDTGSSLRVQCPREQAFDLIGQIDSEAVAGLSVSEPGLEAVFHHAIPVGTPDEGVSA